MRKVVQRHREENMECKDKTLIEICKSLVNEHLGLNIYMLARYIELSNLNYQINNVIYWKLPVNQF